MHWRNQMPVAPDLGHAPHRHLFSYSRRQEALGVAQAHPGTAGKPGSRVRNSGAGPEFVAVLSTRTGAFGGKTGPIAGHGCRGPRFPPTLFRPDRDGRTRWQWANPDP